MPTYGEKYYGFYAAADGRRHRAAIVEEGYAGAARRMALRESPSPIDWGKRGVDIYTPILGSEASIGFWRQEADQAAGALEEMRGARPGRFRLEIRRAEEAGAEPAPSSPLHWEGRVMTDTYQEPTATTGPQEIDVGAVGGLGLLENIPFQKEDGSRYEGRMTFARALWVILGKLSGAPKGFTVACEAEPSQLRAVAGEEREGGPWRYLRFDPAVFFDAEEEAASSCKLVLRQMLYATLSQMWQQSGRWHVVQRRLMARPGGYTRCVFGADGTYLYEEEVPGPRVVSLGEDLVGAGRGLARTGGGLSFRPALGKASVNYAHGPIPGLIKDPGFGEGADQDAFFAGEYTWDELGYDGPWKLQQATYQRDGHEAGWIATKEPIALFDLRRGEFGTRRNKKYEADLRLGLWPGFHEGDAYADALAWVVANGPTGYQEPGRYVEEGQTVALSMRYEIQHHEGEGGGLFQLYWRLAVGSYWLRADGTWEEGFNEDGPAAVEGRTQDGWQLIDPPAEGDAPLSERYGSSAGLPLEKPSSTEIVARPHPTGGRVHLIQLAGTSDNPGERLDPGTAEWDDVSAQVVRPDGTAPDATLSRVSSGLPEEAKEEIDLFLGEGPVRHQPSRLTAIGLGADGQPDPSTEVMATGWKPVRYAAGEAPSSVTHGEMVASEWLRAQSKPLASRQETYRHLAAAVSEAGVELLGRALVIDGVALAAVRVGRQPYHNEATVELVELAYDDAAELTAAEVAKEEGSYVPTSGGESLGRSKRLEGRSQDLSALEETLAEQQETIAALAEQVAALEEGGSAPKIFQGVATVPSGADHVTIETGAGTGVQPEQVQLTPLALPGARWSAGEFDGAGAFDVVMQSAPPSDLPFAWMVVIPAGYTPPSRLLLANSTDGALYEAERNGTGVAFFAEATRQVRGIDHNRESGFVFFAQRQGVLTRTALDGTGKVDIVTGRSDPYGVQAYGDKVYWTEYSTGGLWRAGLDGSDPEQLLSISGSLGHLYIDPIEEAIYLPVRPADEVRRCNLDGSGLETVLHSTASSDSMNGLCLDVEARKMYWIMRSPNQIRRADMDGSNTEIVADGLPSGLQSIRVDPAAAEWYAAVHSRGVWKGSTANLGGAGVEIIGDGSTWRSIDFA